MSLKCHMFVSFKGTTLLGRFIHNQSVDRESNFFYLFFYLNRTFQFKSHQLPGTSLHNQWRTSEFPHLITITKYFCRNKSEKLSSKYKGKCIRHDFKLFFSFIKRQRFTFFFLLFDSLSQELTLLLSVKLFKFVRRRKRVHLK